MLCHCIQGSGVDGRQVSGAVTDSRIWGAAAWRFFIPFSSQSPHESLSKAVIHFVERVEDAVLADVPGICRPIYNLQNLHAKLHPVSVDLHRKPIASSPETRRVRLGHFCFAAIAVASDHRFSFVRPKAATS
jgi:hypothetical protein